MREYRPQRERERERVREAGMREYLGCVAEVVGPVPIVVVLFVLALDEFFDGTNRSPRPVSELKHIGIQKVNLLRGVLGIVKISIHFGLQHRGLVSSSTEV